MGLITEPMTRMQSQYSVALLPLHVGVDLGHAWLQRLADDLQVRVLFIKGPALTQQGLRKPRVSSDIDVLVESRRFDDFCAAVIDRGWQPRRLPPLARYTTTHSKTFSHPSWPCDVDIHSLYPGMLAPPQVAFEALWAARELVPFARQPCAVPSRMGNALILILHSLRGINGQHRHAEELKHVLAAALSPKERAELARLARLTGAELTLQDVASDLGLNLRAEIDDSTSEQLRRWRTRIRFSSTNAYAWLAALRESEGDDRRHLLVSAVWPSRADLLLSRPETVDTYWGRLTARLRRGRRGLHASWHLVRHAVATERDAVVAHRVKGNPRGTF